MDEHTRKMVEMSRTVKIDYHDTGYGSGFVVQAGSGC
jgi:hypothetical protein